MEFEKCKKTCWKENLVGVCDYSCKCIKCTSDAQCDESCAGFYGGLCSDSGKCVCTKSCALGKANAGYCKPCCAQSCIAKGFASGSCSRDNMCTCTKFTTETCDGLCFKSGTDGTLCSNGTCVCSSCDEDICQELCEEQKLAASATCLGRASKCVCNTEIFSTVVSNDKECLKFTGLFGLVPDNSTIKSCYEVDHFCDAQKCREVCLTAGRGIGNCTIFGDSVKPNYCECSLPAKEPSCN